MKSIFTILILNLLLTFTIKAQINEGGVPFSFQFHKRSEIPLITLPTFNIDSAIQNSQTSGSKQKALKFAKLFELNASLSNSGVWDSINGTRIWRLRIKSTNAYSLNFTFGEFNLPPDAKIFIYNSDTTQILGGFTNKNNNPHHIVSVSPIRGDELVIEYNEPLNAAFRGNLKITQVGHDYLNIFKYLSNNKSMNGSSGSCNIDINCSQGADWQKEKRSVCKIIVNNSEACTGAFVNNTENNGIPYFLTAYHCIENDAQAQKTIFYFNYEYSTCGGYTANTDQTLSGATFKAGDYSLDFTLIEANTTPPSTYNVYYSGWNHDGNSSANSYCIHHPNGDVKKISVCNQTIVTGSYGEGLRSYSHWRVPLWSSGDTEAGSSGSPLFDSNHRIIGTLTGGEASCSSPINDYFSKVSLQWETFSGTSSQLKAWLDPLNTTLAYCNGYSPSEINPNEDAQLYSVVTPDTSYCNAQKITPTLKVSNHSKLNLYSFNVSYQIDKGSLHTQSWSSTTSLKGLATNETINITFPEITITEGTHTLIGFVSNPNGKTDNNTTNDTLSKVFIVRTGEAIRLELITDNYGSETNITITDYQKKVVYSGNNFNSNDTIVQNMCLEWNCHKFVINDNGHDGICCGNGNGIYRLIDVTKNDTLRVGSDFGAADSVSFCLIRSVIDTNISGLIKTIGFFPNPIKDYARIAVIDTNSNMVNIEKRQLKAKLFDLTGRLLNSFEIKSSSPILDFTSLQDGIYILKFYLDTQTFIQKIVIQK